MVSSLYTSNQCRVSLNMISDLSADDKNMQELHSMQRANMEEFTSQKYLQFYFILSTCISLHASNSSFSCFLSTVFVLFCFIFKI